MIERRFRDLWERLQGKKPHLPHFLAEIHLAGIRGIDDVRVVFDYPVSVIAGGNASGKSTVLFAAACAYKVPGAGVKDFVPSTLFPDYRPKLGGREDERREAEAGSSFRMAARTMVQLRALALTTASCASWSAWMFRNSVMNSRRASHGICRRLSPAPAAGQDDEALDPVSGHAVHDIPRAGGEGGLVAQAVAAQGDDRRVLAGDRRGVRPDVRHVTLNQPHAGIAAVPLPRRAREGGDVVVPGRAPAGRRAAPSSRWRRRR